MAKEIFFNADTVNNMNSDFATGIQLVKGKYVVLGKFCLVRDNYF